MEMHEWGGLRGKRVAYKAIPRTPLIIISDPYEWQGKTCVTARSCERNKDKRQVGIYELCALVEYEKLAEKE